MSAPAYRLVGRSPLWSMMQVQEVCNFAAEEEDDFCATWDDMERRELDVWAYVMGESGRWEELA